MNNVFIEDLITEYYIILKEKEQRNNKLRELKEKVEG